MLTFAYPWLILALPLPLAVVWLIPPYAAAKPALRVPFLARLADVSGALPREGAAVQRRGWLGTGLLILAWIGVVIALTRPQWVEPPLHREQQTRDLLLLIDLSGSMAATDFANADGQHVDRLTALKQVLDEFLAKRSGDRVGVVVFGDAAFTLVPFTTDLKLARRLVQETAVGMAGPRTAFGDAIGLGITLFERSTVKYKTVIALTDGNDTASRVTPADASRIAKDRGIVIHTVAIGDPASVGEEKLDEEALRYVAEHTGGGFYHALDRAELADIYRRLDTIETRKTETVSFSPKIELFWVSLAFVLLLGLSVQVARLVMLPIRTRRLVSNHFGRL